MSKTKNLQYEIDDLLLRIRCRALMILTCIELKGIGYFTLPYLVHAKAKHVYACEWNPDSIEALKRNLQLNGVQGESFSWVRECVRLHFEKSGTKH